MSAPHQSVLALYPFTRGLGFCFFEDPASPVDWGVKDIRGPAKEERCLAVAHELMALHQPEVLVLEDYRAAACRRADRIRQLYRLLARSAGAQAIEVRTYSRIHIRECFRGAGATTRFEIARVIAGRVDAFGHRLPRVRKLWMAEDCRMYLFDAASLAMAFYFHEGSGNSND